MWVNPCGGGLRPEPHDHPGTEVPTNTEMLQRVILEAHKALTSVKNFPYVDQTKQTAFYEHTPDFMDLNYDWLPRLPVPKTQGFPVDPSLLENIQLDDFLRDTYRDLQILAVALEQVLWDKEHVHEFAEKFGEVNQGLRLVLCELLLFMIERHVEPHPDVNHDVMSDDFQDIQDDNERHIRDWIVFRDYMNVLEYTMEVSRNFIDKAGMPQELPWVNPCSDQHEHDDGGGPLDDRVLMEHIMLQAKDALFLIDLFKHQYLNETFQYDFETHHNKWKDLGYDWLHHVPKELGVPVYPTHFQNIKLDDFLRDMYRDLQTLAVGLEQVEWDQGRGGNPWQKSFREVLQRLRSVLCEVHLAMKHRQVEPLPDVGRDVMPDEIRHMPDDNAHERHIRDWVILREYMILLEYLKEVSHHFAYPAEPSQGGTPSGGQPGGTPSESQPGKIPEGGQPEGEMFWVYPCGHVQLHDEDQITFKDSSDTSTQLQNVITQARDALDYAEGFKISYVSETFQRDSTSHHDDFKSIKYAWLPHVPKELGIPVDPSRLMNVRLDDFLRDTYRNLQILAVGLEQVQHDHAGNPPYQQRFGEIMKGLRKVLCEVLMAMIERGHDKGHDKVAAHPEVSRDVMPNDIRHMEHNTHRNLRDWIIIRDYLVVLEYVIEVSQFFVDPTQNSPGLTQSRQPQSQSSQCSQARPRRAMRHPQYQSSQCSPAGPRTAQRQPQSQSSQCSPARPRSAQRQPQSQSSQCSQARPRSAQRQPQFQSSQC